ncbi:hypothetical protein J1N35_042700 [Gossypium stocksii]|uniref:Uncharacterized protein n=1 Tax=Gossypium stocksii TaxID=47602 RepID=A0A9D3U606_9ROSI|nr:hypothetical protein J1N35_042700 [Gossypium stocksii]
MIFNSKEEIIVGFGALETRETHGWVWKASRSKDMLSTLEGRVTNLEEFMSGMKENIKIVEGRTTKLDSRKDLLKE